MVCGKHRPVLVFFRLWGEASVQLLFAEPLLLGYKERAFPNKTDAECQHFVKVVGGRGICYSGDLIHV